MIILSHNNQKNIINNIFKSISIIIFLSLIVIIFSSCAIKPSFTDENIVSETQRLLKEEFDIDSMVKKDATTLAICITLPKLYSSTKQLSPLVGDYHQNASLVLSRVLLSTDSDIRFYQVNFRGEDTGLELSLLRYVHDLKIFRLQGLSLNDYKKRMVHKNITNIPYLGKRKIRQFFNDQGSLKPEQIIAHHFVSNIRRTNISSDFIKWLSEFAMKKNIENEILEIRMKAIEENNYLFYCKIKETYECKHGFETFIFSNASGGNQEFVFSLSSNNFYNVSMDTFFIITDEVRDNKRYNDIILKYGEPSAWPFNDFIAKKLILPEFLISQIASRIHEKILMDIGKETEDSKVDVFPTLLAVNDEFKNNTFELKFIYRSRKSFVPEKDKNVALEMTRDICNKYQYYQCNTIKIGTLRGESISYNITFNK